MNSKNSAQIRVLCSSTSSLLRDRLKDFLIKDTGLNLVDFVESPILAQKRLEELKPDVLIIACASLATDCQVLLETSRKKLKIPVLILNEQQDTQERNDLHKHGAAAVISLPYAHKKLPIHDSIPSLLATSIRRLADSE